jgi:hypothetical protein
MLLDNTLTAAASKFEEGIDDVAAQITVRMQEEIEELRDLEAPELWNAARRVNRGSRQAQAVHLRKGRVLPEACPDPDLEAAQTAARAGMSLSSVLHAYRIGHAVSLDAWLESVEQLDLPDPNRRACLKAISRFATAYDDRLSNLVGEEFERERGRSGNSPEQRRLARLRALIEGWTDEAEDLPYDLEVEHIGVIAWGPGAKESLSELAAGLDRRLVWASATEGILMAWLGSADPAPGGRAEIAAFQPLGECRLAVGNPASGVDGFRRTHREAGEAHLVANRRSRPVTLYEDVALEALALRNETVAQEFTDSVLLRLNANGERSGLLRETLRAYFAAGQNAVSTAAALGVHVQTVSRRLGTVEELLGCPVNSRRAELELALRLEDLLGP